MYLLPNYLILYLCWYITQKCDITIDTYYHFFNWVFVIECRQSTQNDLISYVEMQKCNNNTRFKILTFEPPFERYDGKKIQ